MSQKSQYTAISLDFEKLSPTRNSPPHKMEYNVVDKVRNYTISHVQHLKTCITKLGVSISKRTYLEHLFMLVQRPCFFRAPVLHNNNEEVNHWLGQVSQKQVKSQKKC